MKSQEGKDTTTQIVTNPIQLLSEELKNKVLKKQSVENIGLIGLVLSAKEVKEELVPLLIRTFVQENNEMRVVIIKSMPKLVEFIGHPNNSTVMVQFLIDSLCVFSEQDIRKEAFLSLQTILKTMELKSIQDELRKIIGQLQKESEGNFQEVVLKLCRMVFSEVDFQCQEELMEVVKGYKEKEDTLVLLGQELPYLIKITPPFPEEQIHSIFKSILESNSSKAKCKLIQAVILLPNYSFELKVANSYLLTLLKDGNSDVVASVIMQTKSIVEIFGEEIRKQLSDVVDAFESKDNTIKTAIIQVLEHIPLTKERKNIIISCDNPNKSLNLSKMLASSLCKIHDLQSLEIMLANSDTQFKNKLFPKLPPTAELHIKLMETLLTQKNWRNKLTLLQNVEKRLEQNEDVDILVPKLLEQLGDKVAVVRMAVVKLLAKIITQKKLSLQDFKIQLTSNLDSKNWFQRQSVHILISNLAQSFDKFQRKDQEVINNVIKKGISDNVLNIRQLSVETRDKNDIKLN